jgi:hypothetical protein
MLVSLTFAISNLAAVFARPKNIAASSRAVLNVP